MGRCRTRLAGPVTVAITAVLLATLTPSAAAMSPTRGVYAARADDPLLAGPAHGQRAIRELGDRLSTAAERNHMTSTKLRHLLSTDLTAWLDGIGQLYFIDPARLDLPAQPAPSDAAAYPLDQTFALHSAPGSSRVIFLDFDGANVSGTAWNALPPAGKGLLPGDHPAWDTDGDPATFGTAERTAIQSIWQRVSEDYAPFDVDVTTQDPGDAALVNNGSPGDTYGVRALITPSITAALQLCNNQCGGIAYVGTYNRVNTTAYAQPAWIFPQQLGPNNTKAIAEAVTHEVGHNLGLSHDGTSGVGYYAGQGSWAPIMGVGYSRPITQWSKGEYADANNAENDLAVIASHGLSYRTDEAGGTPGAAAVLTNTSTGGFITQSADVDVYRIDRTCSGSVTVSVDPAATSPDLDVRLTLLDADGAVLASADPPAAASTQDLATGLAATLTSSLGTGVFYLSVDGIGFGDPATTGYSDYASLGQYTLSTTQCPVSGPTMPLGLVVAKDEDAGTATLSWTAPAYDGGSPVTGYQVTTDGGAPVVLPATARSYTVSGLSLGQDVTMAVAAVNAIAAGPEASISFTMADVPGAAESVAVDAQSSLTQTASLSWASPSDDGGAAVTGYDVLQDGQLVDNVGAAERGYTFQDVPRGVVVELSVRAVNRVGPGQHTSAVAELAPAPTTPTAVTAIAGTGKVVVSWSPPDNAATAQVTGYEIRRYVGQGPASSPMSVGDAARSFEWTGLANGTSYRFSVTAVSGLATSAETLTASVAPAAEPGRPKIGKAKAGKPGGQVTATAVWRRPASTGGVALTGYRVTAYRVNATGAVVQKVVAGLRPPGASSYAMKLPAKGRWRFSVQAVNVVGTGAASARSAPVAAR